MKKNNKELFWSVVSVLEDGGSVSYGQLTICDLRNYVTTRNNMESVYQVHCDDSRFLFTATYKNIIQAVDKYIVIRSRLNEN